MTDVHASLPTVFTTALRTLLADLAATRRDSDDRTTDQVHADVLMTLFSGPAALAPAAQLALGFDEPAWDDNGHFTVVDERQTLQTRSLWDTIRSLAAFLDLTFPDTARAVLHVDVTAETLAAALTGPAPPGAPPGAPSGVPSGSACGDSDSRAVVNGSSPERQSAANEASGHVDGTAAPIGAQSTNRAAAALTDVATACADFERRHRAATIRGLGDIDGELLARLARFADLQRIITDPITGQPIEVSVRRPSKRLRDAVINRDRTCRFPGCQRSGSTSDLDHINPWHDGNAEASNDADGQMVDGQTVESEHPETAAGQRNQPAQTSPMNLACLCREHHRDKHQLHWQPTMLADGTIRWRNPLLGITTHT